MEAIADYPFAKAGVRPGDRIVEVGHVAVGSLGDIIRRIVEHQRGEEVRLAIDRAGTRLELVMTVE